LQQRLVKTGGRLIKHARYYWLLLAESLLARRLFGAMARRIETLPLPAGSQKPPGKKKNSSTTRQGEGDVSEKSLRDEAVARWQGTVSAVSETLCGQLYGA
jgi:hypothetical protein